MKKDESSSGGSGEGISCSIKLLPEDQWVSAAETAVSRNPLNAPAISQYRQASPGDELTQDRLAVLTTKYWGLGGVNLKVGFTDNPEPALRAKILSHMNAWGLFANVRFTESSNNPEVRISRGPGGYWSYLGTDVLLIPADRPTMNLEGFSMSTPDSEFFRVVRHETGHTLGFPHEHMRQDIIDQLDRERTIAYFMRTQGWSRQTVIDQVLTPLNNSALNATAEADPNSIMCYFLPASITRTGTAIPGGPDINANDGNFAGIIYPRPGTSNFFLWRGHGRALLNIPNSRISAYSTVFASISEYASDPRTSRFIGSARMGVYNIAPYNGGVYVWVEVDWSQPLNTCIDLFIF
ncbi:M12 family metallopeptidase [Dyadobacter sp. CY261]|uniref:M12 family metallopeptidase n=1 Tax=Dyadobacter sp. CY261 TaxID=2907203 RepID=UPI001F3183BC|nr:M12 family metallopeptidase [Dyadobacter sp. CY261]MCF0069598.1 M12 family metallopeptidase [Dyadobacter sp. CY261]